MADSKLKAQYRKLQETFPNYTFAQNLKKEQYDGFNCGIYVLKRIMLLDQNPDRAFLYSLYDNPLTYKDAMRARKNGSIRPYEYQPPKRALQIELAPDEDERDWLACSYLAESAQDS